MNSVYRVVNGWRPRSMSRMSLGHARLGQEEPRLVVEVLDKFNQPIVGADVIIKNTRVPWSAAGTTASDGTFGTYLPADIALDEPLEVTATFGGKTNTLTRGAPTGTMLMSIPLDIDQSPQLPVGEPQEGIPTWAWVAGVVAVTGLLVYIAK